MSQPLLSVKDLQISFSTGRALFSRGSRTVDAVRGISFEIHSGETFGLVGESGSGKSTTGRALVRLVEPSAGSITFDRHEVTGFGRQTPDWYRQAVQIVFQNPLASLNPRRTVGDAIRDSLSQRGVPRQGQAERVGELLGRVGLDSHLASRLPRELSGGQRQRVAIARALAMEPRLLICDEAVSALDVSTQSQIVNLLQDLQDDLGISLLFIAHDLGVVHHISDRIGVMYLGELVEVGEADAVYSAPHHPYTRMLLEAIPLPDPAVQKQRRLRRGESVGAEPPSPLNPPSGCSFHTRCPYVMDVCRDGEVVTHATSDRTYLCHLAPDELTPAGGTHTGGASEG